jgi:hypothetical protein
MLVLGISEENINEFDGEPPALVGFVSPFYGNDVVLEIVDDMYDGNPTTKVNRVTRPVDNDTWGNN